MGSEATGVQGAYDTLCAGDTARARLHLTEHQDAYPGGSCVNLATCMLSGGTQARATNTCGPLGGVCCVREWRRWGAAEDIYIYNDACYIRRYGDTCTQVVVQEECEEIWTDLTTA